MTIIPNAIITEIKIADTGLYAQATCGKVSAYVGINDYEIRVICQNSSHKVWKGSGRSFKTIQEALDGYNSPEMKAIIQAVNLRNS